MCGKPGYNVRTCKEAAELSDSSVSDSVIIISWCCGCVIEDCYSRVVERGPFACLGHSLIIYVMRSTGTYMYRVDSGSGR